MAEVYRATDTRLGRQVAVKILSPQLSADPKFVERFDREAKNAAKLSHRNIVSVYDSGSDGDTHFIVMEYVPGRTLAEILAQDVRLVPERAVAIARQVCEGLSFAHREGIVHRDIKPGNIMIARDGSAKLMDFGIAAAVTTDTMAQTQTVMGTATYLSPEQAQGQPVDQRSDIYSLGVVLYEMLTGKPPFSGDTAAALAYQHVQEAPTPPSKVAQGISADLDAVVLRALVKNPANRYATVMEFEGALDRVARTFSGGQVVAPPLEVAEEPPVTATQVLAPTDTGPPPMSTGKKWAIAAGIVALILLLGFGAYALAKGVIGPSSSPTPSGVKLAPNLVGQSQASAEAQIIQAGFQVGTVNQVPRSDKQPGIVLRQDPTANTPTAPGTKINLWVSTEASPTPSSVTPTSPPPPSSAQVPNLMGLTLDQAKTSLKAAGLKLGTVSTQASTAPANQVIGQSPTALTTVPYHSKVDVTVSSGQVVVPDLTCMLISNAQTKLEGLGLVFAQSATPSPNPACPYPNRVGAQDVAPGTAVDPGTTVTVSPAA
jgi:serine/threonine-protein kinase